MLNYRGAEYVFSVGNQAKTQALALIKINMIVFNLQIVSLKIT